MSHGRAATASVSCCDFSWEIDLIDSISEKIIRLGRREPKKELVTDLRKEEHQNRGRQQQGVWWRYLVTGQNKQWSRRNWVAGKLL